MHNVHSFTTSVGLFFSRNVFVHGLPFRTPIPRFDNVFDSRKSRLANFHYLNEIWRCCHVEVPAPMGHKTLYPIHYTARNCAKKDVPPPVCVMCEFHIIWLTFLSCSVHHLRISVQVLHCPVYVLCTMRRISLGRASGRGLNRHLSPLFAPFFCGSSQFSLSTATSCLLCVFTICSVSICFNIVRLPFTSIDTRTPTAVGCV